MEFENSEKLTEAVRKSYYFLDRFLANFLLSVNSVKGHIFIMMEVLDPDKINFLIYRLINDSFFKCAKAMELPEEVIHKIVSPFMVFRLETNFFLPDFA